MILLKCSNCAGTIIRTPDGLFCDSCGMPVSEMNLENERLIESRNRANEARKNFDYDEAIRGYTQLLTENPMDADANWNLALSKFGIEYEYERSITGALKRVPTIHRLRYERFDRDVNYRNAMKYADDNALEYYMTEGKRLVAIQNRLLELVRTEKDVDVFISFKAEDGAGNRTKDSLIAQHIYEQLTSRGIRTFFSRISLQNVSGDEYEPHIFSALHSAKVMLLVATDIGHINYGWVKNEWTRYLDLQKEDGHQSKTLIPVYQGVEPAMFPSRIPMREAIDMDSPDAMLELIHGVSQLVGKKDAAQETQQVRHLIKKMQKALEQKAYAAVIRFGNEVVQISPDNGEAWFLLFMAENRVQSAEELSLLTINWMESRYFSNAYSSSRGLRKQVLEDVKRRYDQEQLRLRKDEKAKLKARLAEEGSRKQVAQAKTLMQAGQYMAAQKLLDDNVIPSAEVYDLRNDCELGIEYEKIDKKNYLTKQLQEAYPEVMKNFLNVKKKPERRFSFGSYKVKWRMVLPILIIFGYICLNYDVGILNLFDSVTMMIAPIATILYIVTWVRVILDTELSPLIKRTIWGVVAVAVIALFVASGNGNGKFATLYLFLVLGISFWISFKDYKEMKNTDMERLYNLYEKQLLLMENQLIEEYEKRFQKLSVYAPLDELTTVWENYMQRMK